MIGQIVYDKFSAIKTGQKQVSGDY